jgi:flavin reductase (DIM6/NTAB) family NADH-FMN oxidoreductase RutF
MTSTAAQSRSERHDGFDLPDADGLALRNLMAHFPTGVTIVGAHCESGDQGMTANSVTCVSLDPPIVAVCTAHGTRTERAIDSSGGFAVTFLAQHQGALARRFARRDHDHFVGIRVSRTSLGHPHLPGGIGFVQCVVLSRIDAGDHAIFVARVTDAVVRGGEPLVFFRSQFGALPQEHI